MAQVVLEAVTKRYGPVPVVQDLDLEVQDGEFLVLLGPSGCGKTTTLRMIAGLEEVSSGRIRIGLRDVTYLPPKDRDIAMVFQNYALYPHMTVYDNMAFGLKLRGVPREEIRRRVQEAAAALGLDGLLDRRPRALSGGQRQRVALGRAIVREPQVFLMDEPLSNLDAKLRTETRVEVKRLQQRLGATVVYVTHDQVEAMTMGDRIVVMKDGVVQQVDTPEGIYRHPRSVFVATFVGTPSMNLLPVELEHSGGELRARVGDQRFALGGSAALKGLRLPSRRALLGVRAEDAALVTDEGSPEADLRGRLVAMEPLGHETLAYVDVQVAVLTLRVPRTWRGESGSLVGVTFDPERIHVFRPDTGSAVAEAV